MFPAFPSANKNMRNHQKLGWWIVVSSTKRCWTIRVSDNTPAWKIPMAFLYLCASCRLRAVEVDCCPIVTIFYTTAVFHWKKINWMVFVFFHQSIWGSRQREEKQSLLSSIRNMHALHASLVNSMRVTEVTHASGRCSRRDQDSWGNLPM